MQSNASTIFILQLNIIFNKFMSNQNYNMHFPNDMQMHKVPRDEESLDIFKFSNNTCIVLNMNVTNFVQI